jgi:hypothetical protein
MTKVVDEYSFCLRVSVLRAYSCFLNNRPLGVFVKGLHKKFTKATRTYALHLYIMWFSVLNIATTHTYSAIKRLRMVRNKMSISSSYLRNTMQVVASVLHNLCVRSLYWAYIAHEYTAI